RRAPPVTVQHTLRLGAAGLLLLGTPGHAAVATAVALTRRQGFAPFAGLVNAVLRRLAAAGPAALEGLDGPRLDTPAWLWASWGARARSIAEIHAVEPPLDLTLRPGAPIPEGGAMLPTGSVRLPAGTLVTALPGFAAGAFWVQDVAAAMPACLLAPRPGERVADLCAAPGGKTAQLAVAGARVTAVDRDPARLARLAENLARLRLAAETVAADVTGWAPGETFPAILLDAPCSATGTIRRHPDILRLRQPRDLPPLTLLQDRLLDAAAALLAPGGRLIYAVCSLQREEGPARIEAARARLALEPDPFIPAELAAMPEARTPEGYFATDPGFWADRGGMDGFFAARLRRP
ncbi:MAG TPA: RsmB/NOP family class I SAM-dependent RNA methyltransferase, partial [Acetobacteraceae bacterium]|nr:RsmB/NOP family class I SAM-dependent RNA methyltransferase [Acetobacteraceae bacterium]